MRILSAAILSLTFCLLACGKSPQGGAPAEKFAEIKKKFDDEFSVLEKRLQTASPADRRNLFTEAKELVAITTDKVFKATGDDPKSEAALDGAAFVIEKMALLRMTGADLDKATKIVLDHHLASPKLKPMLASLERAGDTGQKLLRTVADKTSDKEVKALALFHLGGSFVAVLDEDDDEASAAKLRAEAIGHVEAAVKTAPDAKVGTETLAQAAEALLKVLKLGPGYAVPNVQGTNLEGKKIDLASYKGKVVLLDIWATWCPPCVAMIPHERQMMEAMKGKPFTILSVSVDDDKETLTTFMEKTKMPWDHWWDGPRGEVTKTFRVHSFPTLYLIDAKGVIRNKWVGSPPPAVLDKAVEAVVAEAEKK